MLPQKQDAGNLQELQDISPLFERFINFLDVSEKTQRTYSGALRQFSKFLEINGIRHPQREDVLSFRESLKVDHKAATVQIYIVAVRLFFRWTAQEGIYPNIADKLKGAKIEPGHKKDYLSSRQVRKILSCIDRQSAAGVRDYALLVLMVTTGLRTIEVSRADIQDMRTRGDSTVLYIQGKGRSERSEYVKVAGPAEDAIREYLKTRSDTKPDSPLFSSLSNKNREERLTTRSISRIVKQRLKNAGFDSDRLTAHSLRHTAATVNLLSGATLEETKQLLRHKSLNTTLIYDHELTREKNNSEQRISKAIFDE